WHSSTIGSSARKPAPPLTVWNARNTALSNSLSRGELSSATSCSPSRCSSSPASTRKSWRSSRSNSAFISSKPEFAEQAICFFLAGDLGHAGRHLAAGQRAGEAHQFQQGRLDRADEAVDLLDALAGEVLPRLRHHHVGQPFAAAVGKHHRLARQ